MVRTECEQISPNEEELQDDQFRKVVSIFPRYVCHNKRYPPGRVSPTKDATTYVVQGWEFKFR